MNTTVTREQDTRSEAYIVETIKLPRAVAPDPNDADFALQFSTVIVVIVIVLILLTTVTTLLFVFLNL